VRKVLADMHVPPAWRRWSARATLAIGVALAVAYVPWRVAGGGERVERLQRQLTKLRDEAGALERDNARLEREIHALRTDPQAIEDHARDELGMIYPGELVLTIEAAPASEPRERASVEAAPANLAVGGRSTRRLGRKDETP